MPLCADSDVSGSHLKYKLTIECYTLLSYKDSRPILHFSTSSSSISARIHPPLATGHLTESTKYNNKLELLTHELCRKYKNGRINDFNQYT